METLMLRGGQTFLPISSRVISVQDHNPECSHRSHQARVAKNRIVIRGCPTVAISITQIRFKSILCLTKLKLFIEAIEDEDFESDHRLETRSEIEYCGKYSNMNYDDPIFKVTGVLYV